LTFVITKAARNSVQKVLQANFFYELKVYIIRVFDLKTIRSFQPNHPHILASNLVGSAPYSFPLVEFAPSRELKFQQILIDKKAP
jgi:hypothetical protein